MSTASINDKIGLALERLDKAITEQNPRNVFGLYSGGHDSFSACYIASLHPRCNGVVHINTGIGIEATRNHVIETAAFMKWGLIEMAAIDHHDSKGRLKPMLYDDLVMQYGFPGAFGHGMMYNRLKERQIRNLERAHSATSKLGEQIMLISGCRSEESIRRMGTTEEVQIDGRRIWCAPIHDWSKLDTSMVIEHAKAKRNPVVDLIHKSGECCCGAFANNGELQELSMWDATRPTYERIIALQKRVRAAGFPWGWEEQPPKEYLEEKRGQTFIPVCKQFLCWKCNPA